MIRAATGHRPEKLGGCNVKSRLALGGLAIEHLTLKRPDKMIVGMAQGWDQAVAMACVILDIPFIAAVPFEGQEKRWPTESQRRYNVLLEEAAEVRFISKLTYGTDHEVAQAMQTRNVWMVDHADRLSALWDGSWGGTFNCIQYARKRGVPVDNLWTRWALPEDLLDLLG